MKTTTPHLNTVQNYPNLNLKVSKLLKIDDVSTIAKQILTEIMGFRRVSKSLELCDNADCETCTSIHLPKLISAIEFDEPIKFVLPAFPGKSPNLEKVLGAQPDYAEELSLQFLGSLCEKIKLIYPPGIKIILCSDGRVFSDVVGMKESDVTNYQAKLGEMIERLGLKDISTFNLDDFYEELSFNQMRAGLMKSFGRSIEFLKYKVKNGSKDGATFEQKEANLMYCGITRFMFEDANFEGQTKTRSALQKESKARAYEVIRRSNAWSDLIAGHFSSAVRLSIHPQPCGSEKLGIRLIADESWMTPWHGVAVETENGFVLLKRSKAEELGAKLVYSSEGSPSHFKLENV